MTVNRNFSRDQEIIKRFRSGETTQQLGKAYNVSRQRIQQVLAGAKIRRRHGGQSKITERKRVEKKIIKETKLTRRLEAKYGITSQELRLILRDERLESWQYYIRQRINCATRLIEFNMTFPEWVSVWDKSGKWEQRGLARTSYVMCRINTDKGFNIDNVHIVQFKDCKTLQVRGDKQ